MDDRALRLFRRVYSWRFKRCNTPDEARVIAVIDGCVAAGRPLPFVGYWGCGDRGAVNACDMQALAHLGTLADGARALFAPGVDITFVLTDVHAAVNGKDAATMRRYFGAISGALAAAGWRTVALSGLWAAYGFAPEEIDRRAAARAEAWAGLSQRRLLVSSAAKHARGVEPETAARRYWAACTVDAEVIAARFAGSVLLTYNGREYEDLLPPLPKLYLYSLRKKTSVKPWFCG